MSFDWIHEGSPRWDDGKARIIGAAPPGVFDFGAFGPGDPVPGEWWRVEETGAVVAYGWIDTAWGDAEMLLAVDPERQGHGVGGFILNQLDREAAARGVNYLCNVVRPTHPDRERVTAWLQRHGFELSSDGLLRRRVDPALASSRLG
jgi:GNAT superfamily N-acetyltransferase